MKLKQPSELGATDQLGRRRFLGALPVGFCALVSCRKPLPPNLFACNERDLHTIARRAAGGKIDPDQIQRNSAGSSVYIINSDRRSQKILVISSSSPPTTLVPPPGWVTIADDGTVVAWIDDKNASLEFQTGFQQEIPKLAIVEFTPGSRYYTIAGADDTTTVYATEKPGVPLARAHFSVQKIFCKNDRLYIFGYDGDYYARTKKNKEIMGRVFRIFGGAMTVERDFRIPRPMAAASPFSPLDLDNWSDNLLCIDVRDEFGAEWFLYNLHSGRLTDIGAAHTYGLFLQDDLIRFLRFW
jgi:hypothetical protein